MLLLFPHYSILLNPSEILLDIIIGDPQFITAKALEKTVQIQSLFFRSAENIDRVGISVDILLVTLIIHNLSRDSFFDGPFVVVKVVFNDGHFRLFNFYFLVLVVVRTPFAQVLPVLLPDQMSVPVSLRTLTVDVVLSEIKSTHLSHRSQPIQSLSSSSLKAWLL